MSIPASFRRVLEQGDPDWTEGLQPQLVIVYGDKRAKYLECFTVSEIEAIEDRISRMKRGSKRRLLERIYSTQSITTTVDDTGRIVLGAKLREQVGITGEAHFASNINTFQIWNPDAYEADALTDKDEALDEMADDMHPLDILDEEDDLEDA